MTSSIQNHSFLLKMSIPMLSATNRVERETDMARIMSRIDENGDGKISPSELRNCMLALGENLSIEEAEEAVDFIDTDGDGMLGLEDFMKLANGEGDEEKHNKCLKEAFSVYELEGEGIISPRSLRDALGRLGERRTVEECEVMIRRFDVDKDGVLTFEEFEMMMMV